MKRRRWLTVAFLAVILSGCNQKQVASLILAVGFHPEWNPREEGTGRKREKITKPTAADPWLEQLVAAMLDLQIVRPGEAQGRSDVQRIDGILNRIHAASEELVSASDLTPAERLQVRETEMTAWNFAADLAPTQFTQRRDSFRQTHLSQVSSESDRSDASAQRILGEYLATPSIPAGTRIALNLHALSYPQCPMNVQLFSTMAERLANEGQLRAAVQIASDGTTLCSGQPGVQKLQDQVNRILAEHPTTPGLPLRLDLSDLRGRVVVVTFWSSECPECRQEMALLKKLRASYRRDKVEFLGVSLDDQREAVQYLQDNDIDWRQIFTAKKGQSQLNHPLAKQYCLSAIPFTIVVDKQGVIAASGIRGELRIENAILDQLAQ